MDLNSSVLEIARIAEVPSELFKSSTFSSGLLHLDLTHSPSSSDESSLGDDDEDFDTMEELDGTLDLSLPESLDRSKMSSLAPGNEKAGLSISEILHSMIISEQKLSELRLKDRQSLSVIDQIALRFNEVVVPLQKELDEARNTLDISRKELNLAVFNINSQSAELTRLRNTSSSEIERFKSEYEDIRYFSSS